MYIYHKKYSKKKENTHPNQIKSKSQGILHQQEERERERGNTCEEERAGEREGRIERWKGEEI